MLKVALCDVRGLLKDLLDKLSGDQGSEWVEALKKFLRRENPWVISSFPIWKTVKIGTGLKNADDFRQAILAIGHKISHWGNVILGKKAFAVSDKEEDIDLVVLSNAELGFEKSATVKETLDRARQLGLELCPSEVAPQLRRQYLDQPMNEWLMIAMEPIAASEEGLLVFTVGHDFEGLWLSAYDGRPDSDFVVVVRWVFRRKSST